MGSPAMAGLILSLKYFKALHRNQNPVFYVLTSNILAQPLVVIELLNSPNPSYCNN